MFGNFTDKYFDKECKSTGAFIGNFGQSLRLNLGRFKPDRFTRWM